MSKPTPPPEVKEFYVDDWLYLGLMPMKAGQVGTQHVHEYEHPTVVCYGTVSLKVDGRLIGRFVGPTYVTIKAGEQHEFTAETDALLICAHNLRGEGYPRLMED